MEKKKHINFPLLIILKKKKEAMKLAKTQIGRIVGITTVVETLYNTTNN